MIERASNSKSFIGLRKKKSKAPLSIIETKNVKNPWKIKIWVFQVNID